MTLGGRVHEINGAVRINKNTIANKVQVMSIKQFSKPT